MTHFDESDHPREGDGKFVTKQVPEVNIGNLIVHGEPAVERIQNVLRDAVERGELTGQTYIESDDWGRPFVEFTDASSVDCALEAKPAAQTASTTCQPRCTL